MDDDDLRRGNPTTHIKYDEQTAVLAGDGLLTTAFDMIAKSNLPSDIAIQCVSELASCAGASGMVAGQMIDLRAHIDTPDDAGIARLQRLKTGRLIDAGCMLACHIMNATDCQKSALSKYTQNIGLAFQIADDILDVTGNAETTGKAVGKDNDAGKSTYVQMYGLDGAKDKAQTLIANAISALDIFDRNSDNLTHLASYIITREK